MQCIRSNRQLFLLLCVHPGHSDPDSGEQTGFNIKSPRGAHGGRHRVAAVRFAAQITVRIEDYKSAKWSLICSIHLLLSVSFQTQGEGARVFRQGRHQCHGNI